MLDENEMTQEERDIREYYRLHAEVSNQNPYDLMASNGGLGAERLPKPEGFKPKREYEPPELFKSPPAKERTTPERNISLTLERKKRSFSRGGLHNIPIVNREDDDGGYNSLTAGLEGNGKNVPSAEKYARILKR